MCGFFCPPMDFKLWWESCIYKVRFLTKHVPTFFFQIKHKWGKRSAKKRLVAHVDSKRANNWYNSVNSVWTWSSQRSNFWACRSKSPAVPTLPVLSKSLLLMPQWLVWLQMQFVGCALTHSWGTEQKTMTTYVDQQQAFCDVNLRFWCFLKVNRSKIWRRKGTAVSCKLCLLVESSILQSILEDETDEELSDHSASAFHLGLAAAKQWELWIESMTGDSLLRRAMHFHAQ